VADDELSGFTNLILDISAHFNRLEFDPDPSINWALERIGRFCHVDRSYLFLHDDDNNRRNTHEWCADGIHPEIDNLQEIPTLPWWSRRLWNREVIAIPRVDELPEEAAAEHEFLSRQDIRSIIAVPMVLNNRLLGYLGLDSVKSARSWSEGEVILLQTAGDVFSNTLYRQRNFRKGLELEREKALNTAKSEFIEQLRFANDELEAFASSVSHDLRTPLRAINGFSTILLEDHANALDEEARQYLTRICDKAQAMGLLIDALLKLSKAGRQELHRQDCDLEQLARDAWQEMLTQHPDSSAEFVCDSLPRCQADPTLLQQVLENLISNAFKYSANSESPRIEVGHHNGAYCVRDNGAGFDVSRAEEMFGMFKRLHSDEEFKGTGVGLALVKRVIERHGGSIRAESVPDQGAAFYFTVPDCSS
jgi:signal transduction histidine kinase